MSKFTVVMPAHNEASALGGFLLELRGALGDRLERFVVVDDSSTDATGAVLERLQAQGLPLTVLRNERNLGHGPSTIRALEVGREMGLPVIAVDSDGQFMGSDIARLCAAFESGAYDVVEGVRVSRQDPAFRRITSWGTRVLVSRDCAISPCDPNTPLRVYDNDALKRLLHDLPPRALTPNLMVSTIVRRGAYQYAEVGVRSLPRRGNPEAGTWGNAQRAIPSGRFLRFCWDATREWWTFTHRNNV